MSKTVTAVSDRDQWQRVRHRRPDVSADGTSTEGYRRTEKTFPPVDIVEYVVPLPPRGGIEKCDRPETPVIFFAANGHDYKSRNYRRDFTDDRDGVTYFSVAHFVECEKVRYFRSISALNSKAYADNDALLKRIVRMTDIRKIKELTRHIEGYDHKLWVSKLLTVLDDANYIKFFEHPDLAEKLMQTNQAMLVETSLDKVMGIGALPAEGETSLKIERDGWHGKSLMGKSLQRVRGGLMERMVEEENRNDDI